MEHIATVLKAAKLPENEPFDWRDLEPEYALERDGMTTMTE